jgi:hypothetical protein
VKRLSLKKLLNNTTFADKILFLTLVSLSLSGINFLKMALPESSTVKIEVDGKPVYLLPLDKDRTVSVEGPEGRTTVEIRGRKVRINESPCRNKLCIKQGWIRSGAIICLPNRVVVTVGDRDGKHEIVDAITG